MHTTTFIGAPIFCNHPAYPFYAPYAYQDQMRAIRAEYRTGETIKMALAREYYAIGEALCAMQIPFMVAWSDLAEQLLPGKKDELDNGNSVIEFPSGVNPLLSTYIRDVAMTLPGVILINDEIDLKHRPQLNGCKVIRSPYGEGGRLIIGLRSKVALVSDRFLTRDSKTLSGKDLQVGPLVRAGFRVGYLPAPVMIDTVGDLTGCIFDEHLDRSYGAFEDSDGRMHLVADPGLHTGFTGCFTPPRHGPDAALERCSRVCAELDIKLHVPSKLEVPMSIGFYQFNDGRVLMTGGDEEVRSIVAEILGDDRVFTTSIPLRCNPARCRAGLRCLVNELPANVTEVWK